MPYAVVFEGAVDGMSRLRAIKGNHLQAAFLKVVEKADPSLSAELHDGDALRAYSLALLAPPLDRAAHAAVAPAALRVACLDDRIFPALSRALGGPAPALRLGPATFAVSRAHAAPGAHPWAGSATYGDLQNLAEASCLRRAIRMEFVTPTAFRQGRRDEPLPVPEHVFGGLARRWDAAVGGGLRVPEGFAAEVRERVVVERFDCRTLTAEIGDGQRQTGFVGDVEFRCLGDLEEASREGGFWYWCHLLAEAGFYSGVGRRTSRGLGLVRKV